MQQARRTACVVSVVALATLISLVGATSTTRYSDCSSICHRTGIIGRFAGCRCSLTLFSKRAMGLPGQGLLAANPENQLEHVYASEPSEPDHHHTGQQHPEDSSSSTLELPSDGEGSDGRSFLLPLSGYEMLPSWLVDDYAGKVLRSNKDSVSRFLKDGDHFRLMKRFAATRGAGDASKHLALNRPN